MARILITGGAGYVESHCALALAKAGHDGIVFDNLIYGHREFVRWGQFVEGDIRDGNLIDEIFATAPIDAVLHFAALAYVGDSVIAPGRYIDVNINGTRVLLDAMVRAGVDVIVFSSRLCDLRPTWTCSHCGEHPSWPVPVGCMLRPSDDH
jgi:UDP-glucose 4-epimerase